MEKLGEVLKRLSEEKITVVVRFEGQRWEELILFMTKDIKGEKWYVETRILMLEDMLAMGLEFELAVNRAIMDFKDRAKREKVYTVMIQGPSGYAIDRKKIRKEGAKIIWEAYVKLFGGHVQMMDDREKRGGIAYDTEIESWKKQGVLPVGS